MSSNLSTRSRKNSVSTIVLSGSIFLFAVTPVLLTPSSTAKPGDISQDFIDRQGCKNCHLINGDGGTVGPPLDGIGSYRDRAYIVGRLTDPQQLPKSPYHMPQKLMAHLKMNKAVANSIADFLLALPKKQYQVNGHKKAFPEDAPGGSLFSPDPKSSSSDKGLELFKNKGCFACHAIGPIGGNLAPNLAGIGAVRSRIFISNRIASGAVLIPRPEQNSSKQMMPAMKLSEAEIKSLTDFLLTLPQTDAKSKKP